MVRRLRFLHVRIVDQVDLITLGVAHLLVHQHHLLLLLLAPEYLQLILLHMHVLLPPLYPSILEPNFDLKIYLLEIFISS